MAVEQNGYVRKIAYALAASAIGWLFLSVQVLQTELDVIASEKIRNERAIEELRQDLNCLRDGTCGDRYTASMAERDFTLRDQRMDWIERHWDLKNSTPVTVPTDKRR